MAHSQYGRNRNEVTINNNINHITGIAGDTVTASESTSTTNTYNTTKGMLASTTGNIYGVYDMNGGAYEYTANWNSSTQFEYQIERGKAIDGTVYFDIGMKSDRTKTAYRNVTGEDSGEIVNIVCRIGDGIKETFITNDDRLWFLDGLEVGEGGYPFYVRGELHNFESSAGIFATRQYMGEPISEAVRVILSPDKIGGEQHVN